MIKDHGEYAKERISWNEMCDSSGDTASAVIVRRSASRHRGNEMDHVVVREFGCNEFSQQKIFEL